MIFYYTWLLEKAVIFSLKIGPTLVPNVYSQNRSWLVARYRVDSPETPSLLISRGFWNSWGKLLFTSLTNIFSKFINWLLDNKPHFNICSYSLGCLQILAFIHPCSYSFCKHLLLTWYTKLCAMKWVLKMHKISLLSPRSSIG